MILKSFEQAFVQIFKSLNENSKFSKICIFGEVFLKINWEASIKCAFFKIVELNTAF